MKYKFRSSVQTRWALGLTLLFPILSQAETAQQVWEKLVGAKAMGQAAYAYVEADPELPHVLIYGDSISIAYTARVREQLQGKANVYRIHLNGGDSSTLVEKITALDQAMRNPEVDGHWAFDWDVVHFNVGLHDLKYVNGKTLDVNKGTQVHSTEEYAQHLKADIEYLKTYAPKAKLIFCTTTPVPENSTGRKAGDAVRYNAAAQKVLEGFPEVAINDLYAFVLPQHAAWWTSPNNVHYNAAGFSAQGDEVARVIEQALPKKQ